MLGLPELLSFAVRSIRRKPRAAILAILVLGPTTGGTAAFVAFALAVTLPDLPYARAERLVEISETTLGDRLRLYVTPAAYFHYRTDKAGTISSMAAVQADTTDSLMTVASTSFVARRTLATPEFFDVLGAAPIIGTTFRPETNGAVLSYDLWRRLGADDSIIGKRLTLTGFPSDEIVGVMPPSFNYPPTTEIWQATTLGNAGPESRWRVIGRLADDIMPDAAAEALDVAVRSTRNGATPVRTAATPLKEVLFGTVRPVLWLIYGAFGTTLLACCLCLGTLRQTQIVRRGDELRMCMALGASRQRIIGQLVAETTLITAAAAVVALIVCLWLRQTLFSVWFPALQHSEQRFTFLMYVALLATTGLVAIVFVVVTLAPVFDIATDAYHRQRSRHTWLDLSRMGFTLGASNGVAVALACTSLTLAFTFAGGIQRFTDTPIGFAPDQLLAVEIRQRIGQTARLAAGPSSRHSAEFYFLETVNKALQSLRNLTQVSDVAITGYTPFRDRMPPQRVVSPTAIPLSGPFRWPPIGSEQRSNVILQRVTSNYHRLMGIRLLSGRLFEERDALTVEQFDNRQAARRPGVAVVERMLARRLWPDQDAVGKFVILDGDTVASREVVGIVEDVVVTHAADNAPPQFYVPWTENPTDRLALVIRTSASFDDTTQAVASELQKLDPDLVAYSTVPVTTLRHNQLRSWRAMASALICLSLCGVLAAVIGVYGTLAVRLASRRKEIAVRLALGAPTGVIFKLVVLETAVMLVVASAISLPATVGSLRAASPFFVGLGGLNATHLGLSLLVILAASIVSMYVPMRQAMQVDFINTLKSE